MSSNDSISTTIHNAFLLGWSIMELKSRVQITASNVSLDTIISNPQNSSLAVKSNLSPANSSAVNQPPRSGPTASIANQQAAQVSSPGRQQMNPPDTDGNQLSQPATTPPVQQPNMIDALLENVILNDIVTTIEKYTETATKALSPKGQSLSSELRDNAWLTSMMREIFGRIVTLHLQRFPNSDTTDTIYDLHPPDPPDKPDQYTGDFSYLYLYPGELDYANVGVSNIKKTGATGNDIATHFVQNFRLYDVTRRALNCLTLLWTTPEEALDPTMIARYQRMMVFKILNIAPPKTTPDGSTTANEQFDTQMKDAIKALSSLIIRLLDAWDGFLRETYYVDIDSPSNETELIAFQAGRSMAGLTWSISVALVPLENSLQLTPTQQKDPTIVNRLTKKVRDTWVNVFNERDINTLQLQINSLSKALDNVPDSTDKSTLQSGTNDVFVTSPGQTPGQAIQAVNWSIEYWQRAVTQMCIPAPSEGTVKPQLTPTSAVANSQPGNVGQIMPLPTVANPPSDNTELAEPLLPLYWGKSAKALRLTLIKQAEVWRALIMGERDLQSFNTLKVTQNILNDFMQELEDATSSEFQRIRQRGLTSFKTTIYIGLLVLVLIIAGAIAATFVPQVRQLIDGQITNPLTLIVLLWGGAAAFVSSFIGKVTDALTRFGPAGTTVAESFEIGYERVLLEFASLNHNIAITYPLIEYFAIGDFTVLVENPKGGDKVRIAINDGYDFLNYVFWTSKDRDAEVKQVVRAAFGPIGAFVGTELLSMSGSSKGGV